MLTLVSRRTIILFSLAVASFAILINRTWEQKRPCREWRDSQKYHPSKAALNQQPDTPVVLDPCSLWIREMPWIDKLLAFLVFSSTVAFMISLIQDVVHYLQRRPIARK